MFSKKTTKFEVNLPYFLTPAIPLLLMSMSKQCGIFFFQILRPSWKTSTLVKKHHSKKMKEIFNKMWQTQK